MASAIAEMVASQERKRAAKSERKSAQRQNIFAGVNLGLEGIRTGVGAYGTIKGLAQEAAAQRAMEEYRGGMLGETRRATDTDAAKLGLEREKFEFAKTHPDPQDEVARIRYGQLKGEFQPEEETAKIAERRRLATERGIAPPGPLSPPYSPGEYDVALRLLQPFEKGGIAGISEGGKEIAPESLAKADLLQLAEVLTRIREHEGPAAIPDSLADAAMGEIIRRRLLGGGAPITEEGIASEIPEVFEASLTQRILNSFGSDPRLTAELQRSRENTRREALRGLLRRYLGPQRPPDWVPDPHGGAGSYGP